MNLDEVKILVIGPNVWGRGDTLADALRLASNPKSYQAFLCHEGTRVDGLGRVTYPKKAVPREILRRAVRKGKELITFQEPDGEE